jgi:hypothetical protein
MIYDNEKCPVCGHRTMTAVNCEREAATICMSHCYECSFFIRMFAHCSYRRQFADKKRIMSEQERVRGMIQKFKRSTVNNQEENIKR